MWEDDRGNLVQVSVALLDYLWEARVEITNRVGPFDDGARVLERTTNEVDRWLASNGVELELEL